MEHLCQNCQALFNDENPPYLLECGDNLCLQCINEFKQQNSSYKCKICSESTNFNSSSALYKNLAYLQIINQQVEKKQQPIYICSRHSTKQKKKKIQFKCNIDQELLCSKCVLDHQNHSLESYTDNDLKKDIKNLINQFNWMQALVIQKIQQLQDIYDENITFSSDIKNIFIKAKDFLTQPFFQGKDLSNIKFPLFSYHPIQRVDSIIMDNTDKDYLQTILPESIKSVKRIFCTKNDGFKSQKFHLLCDGKGPTLTVVESEHNQKFGSFSTISQHSTGSFNSASGSFLFSLTKQEKYHIYRNATKAHYGDLNYGPTFGGGHDFYISNNCCENQYSHSNLGHTYQLPQGLEFNTDISKTYLAGSFKFRVNNYEVFQLQFK